MLGKLFGSTHKPASEAFANVMDVVFASDKERLGKKSVLARLAENPKIIQDEIDKIGVEPRTVFVAGWRPFIGWVCGIALVYSFVLRDMMMWVIAITNIQITPPPALHLEIITTVLYALLGLGTLRTVEKATGRSK